MSCPNCADRLLLPSDMLIHAESLESAKWTLRCDCNHVFTVEDFMSAGAVIKRGCDAILGLKN